MQKGSNILFGMTRELEDFGLLSAACFFIFAFGLASFSFLIPDPLRPWVFHIYLAVTLICLYLKGWRPLLGWVPHLFWQLIGVFLIYGLVLWGLDFLASSFHGTGERSIPHAHGRGQFLAMVMVAPVMEELFFRDVLVRVLWRRFAKFWLAVLTGAFLFMIAHLSLYFGAFILGILSALLFRWSRSIYPSILFHSLSNLSWYFMPLLFPSLWKALVDLNGLTLFFR